MRSPLPLLLFLKILAHASGGSCPLGTLIAKDARGAGQVCSKAEDCQRHRGSLCLYSAQDHYSVCCHNDPKESPSLRASTGKKRQQPYWVNRNPFRQQQEPNPAPAPIVAQVVSPAAPLVGPIGASRPILSPLISGLWTIRAAGTNVLRSSSVTLVQDSGYNIIVDTSATCRAAEIVSALSYRGLVPANIHVVVLTQGSPDHSGNLALFPNAQIIFDRYIQRTQEFITIPLTADTPVSRLTDNTDIYRVPGHSPRSIALVVRNVPNIGSVGITGDTFIIESDMTDDSVWRGVSMDPELQLRSRNVIVCQTNWILPGHGLMFRTTDAMKTAASCPRSGIDGPTPVAPAPQPVPPAPGGEGAVVEGPPPTPPEGGGGMGVPPGGMGVPPGGMGVPPGGMGVPPGEGGMGVPPGGGGMGVPPTPPEGGAPPPAEGEGGPPAFRKMRRTLVEYKGKYYHYYLDSKTGYVISVPYDAKNKNFKNFKNT